MKAENSGVPTSTDSGAGRAPSMPPGNTPGRSFHVELLKTEVSCCFLGGSANHQQRKKRGPAGRRLEETAGEQKECEWRVMRPGRPRGQPLSKN